MTAKAFLKLVPDLEPGEGMLRVTTVTVPSRPAERGRNTNFLFLPGEEMMTHAISRSRLLEAGSGLPQDYVTLDKVPRPSVPRIPLQQSENTNSTSVGHGWDD